MAGTNDCRSILVGCLRRTERKADRGGDFTHKDPLAAGRIGMEKLEYAIGGVDPDFKTVVEAMGKAMDKANIPWTINAAYRDVFRQGITEGKVKASPTGSWHGGTGRVPHQPGRGPTALPNWPGYADTSGVNNRATPAEIKGGADAYGLGRALDVTGIRGNQEQVWSWIDQNGAKFGISRPMGKDDPPHIQPTANFRELAAKIRAGFDPLTGKYQTADGKPDPAFARKQEAQDRAQREAAQQPVVDVPRPPADIPPTVLQPPDIPRPPADIPPPAASAYGTAAAEHRQPAARPPADIPSLVPPRATGPNEFDIPVTPPRAGQLDPVMMARTIEAIQKEALRGINPNTTKEQAMAQGAKGRAALIAAGVPPAMARAAMLDTGAKTAVLMGYGPGGPNSTVLGFPIPQSTDPREDCRRCWGGNAGLSTLQLPVPCKGRRRPRSSAAMRHSEALSILRPAGAMLGRRLAVEPGQQAGRARRGSATAGQVWARNIDPSDILVAKRSAAATQSIDPDRGVGRTPVIRPRHLSST